MADTGESLAGLAAAAALGSIQGVVGDDDSLAVRARAWFIEAWHSPLWTKYRQESTEDLGYYRGGAGQWSKDGSDADLKALTSANRAAVSINHVQSIVDVLTGFERQNRFDPKVQAQGEEDEDDARLMTWLLKFVREQANAAAVESTAFEDGVISGMAAVNVRVDWTEDPHNGTIQLERLTPGVDVMWDPAWTKDDLSDARYVLIYKNVFVKDLQAQYPDHREAIRAALNAGEAGMAGGGQLSDFSPRDGYGGVQAHAQDAALSRMFYDKTEDQVLVLEAWYRDYEDAWIVANKASGAIHEAESGEAARAVAKSDPENLTAIRRQRRVIKMGVTLPAVFLTLEEDDTPYDNDTQHYSVIPYIAKRKGDDVYGMVRNLKDPQRVENKRESQVLDLIARFANMRPLAQENSVLNAHTLQNVQDQSPVFYKPGHQPPAWYYPQALADLFRLLTTESDRMQVAMRRISGINVDILGLREKGDPSGIAIARTQAQGQVIATVFFDNYRAFKRHVNERLARRVQQVFTSERTFRLTNELGERVSVKVNPVDAKGKTRDEYARLQASDQKTDRARVLRNLQEFLTYDVVISDAPATPTMRSMQLFGLLEVLRTLPNLPAAAPTFLIKVVELLDIEGKGEILAELRRTLGGAGAIQPPAGPMSTGGGQVEAGQGLATGGAPPAAVPPPATQGRTA